MASLTIRNLSSDTKTKLKQQAAASGCSLESYIRSLLDQAADTPVARTAAFPYDLMDLVEPGEDIDPLIEQQDRSQPVIEL